MVSKEQAIEAAAVVLDYMGQLDPQWAERIKITKDEHHYDDLQTCGCYIANQLEAGMHTVIPRHPFFEPGFELPEMEGQMSKCSQCHKSFRPAYVGQPLCSNECAQLFYKKR